MSNAVKSSNSVAEPIYRKLANLPEALIRSQSLRPGDRMIELGCGDGEASLDAAPRCASVMGYDVSAALVEQANVRAREAGLTHVHFRTADLEDAALPEVDDNVDVLLCLGVLSCLPDDAAARVIDHVGRGLRPGALLVLRETVSSGARRDVVYASGYCGRYRPLDAYLQAVADAGFTLFEDVPLTAEGGLENHLWLFRRDGNPGRVPKPSRDELGPA
jgi:cyclopropane fatty-acyl-phospholipid synthase-like methyltransferase